MKELGGDWDGSVCYEIPKESIQSYVIKKKRKKKEKTTGS